MTEYLGYLKDLGFIYRYPGGQRIGVGLPPEEFAKADEIAREAGKKAKESRAEYVAERVKAITNDELRITKHQEHPLTPSYEAGELKGSKKVKKS